MSKLIINYKLVMIKFKIKCAIYTLLTVLTTEPT